MIILIVIVLIIPFIRRRTLADHVDRLQAEARTGNSASGFYWCPKAFTDVHRSSPLSLFVPR